jgi:hemoglobin
MFRFIFTLLLAASAALFHGLADARNADARLYQALGEKAGLARLMDRFEETLAFDTRTQVFFANADKPRLKEQLTGQLFRVSGRPCVYTGVQMRGVHRGLEIGRSDFNALVEGLQDKMGAQGIAFSAQNGLLAGLAPVHCEIVTRD